MELLASGKRWINFYQAEKVAERYCNCMKSNNATKDFIKASELCGHKVSDETRDSVKLFMDRFQIIQMPIAVKRH